MTHPVCKMYGIRRRLFLLFVAPVLFALCAAARADSSDAGKDILQKCLDTYNNMTSYQGKANSDSILLDANGHSMHQVGTSLEMKYRRPNRLLLNFVTPGGSRVVWSNAKELGLYDPSTRKFEKSAPLPSLDTLIPALAAKAGVVAAFDPLYGLGRTNISNEFTGFRVKSDATYNGHPVYLVTAVMHNKQVIDWSWWIDRKSMLLYKVQQVVPNIHQKAVVKQGGQKKTVTLSVSLLLRELITSATPNAPVSDADFNYVPPAGATERIRPPGPVKKP